MRIAIDPAVPLRNPQSAASGDQVPPISSASGSITQKPTSPAPAVTRTGLMRLEAMPPKKSAAP